MRDIVWSPSEDYVERANVTRFMRAHGIESYGDLVRRSIGDRSVARVIVRAPKVVSIATR